MSDHPMGPDALAELVLETAEPAAVRRLGPHHLDLGASRITAAAQLGDQDEVVRAALVWAQRSAPRGANRRLVATHAVEHLAIEMTKTLLGLVPGRVGIEIDGRLAYKRRQLVDRGRLVAQQLTTADVDLDRVLLKIPATWEGIEAARKLGARDGIQCQMTLVFGMHQLAASADAGVAVVAPVVGRITDWHRKRDGVDGYPMAQDPGVERALQMHRYLVDHGYHTQLMPCTFRSIDQALALRHCPLLSLPPKLWAELDVADSAAAGGPTLSGAATPDKLVIDGGSFQAMHAADAVSSSKLQAGLKNLGWAMVSQQKQLAEWIVAEQDQAASRSTLALFDVWDYDGDGFIDREEWSGTEEVFNALDRDGNGRISLQEMAVGLGAPYKEEEP